MAAMAIFFYLGAALSGKKLAMVNRKSSLGTQLIKIVYPGKLPKTPEWFRQALFSDFFENIFPSQIPIETLQ